MKKIFSLLLLALFATTSLWSYDFQSGDLYYNITSDTTVEVTYQYDWASNNYAGLTTATIPETVTHNSINYSVTSIGRYAFNNCSSLTSITIPNSVTSIGDHAFRYSSLTSITIPESVTSIGDGAFYWCQSLESIVVEQGNVTYDSRENCNAIIETASNTLIIGCKNTTIPNSVTSIGEDAFFDCQNLNSIVIPNSITNIGESAFGGCISLASITIPNSVIDIGEWAFGECISLASCTIGNGVRSIGYATFYYCISLTSITIPKSVTNIGEFAFGACYALTSISIENGNTQYDSRDNCNAIIETATNTLIAGCQNTIIPNSVTSIGDDAFHACFTLTSITIPNSVTSIGSEAFVSCESLTTVICKAIEVPELESNVFNRMPLSEATLYVPAESLEDYKAAGQWKEFGTILPLDKAPSAVENTRLPITNSTKLLRNGQVYILQDGKTYTITGQKL